MLHKKGYDTFALLGSTGHDYWTTFNHHGKWQMQCDCSFLTNNRNNWAAAFMEMVGHLRYTWRFVPAYRQMHRRKRVSVKDSQTGEHVGWQTLCRCGWFSFINFSEWDAMDEHDRHRATVDAKQKQDA